MDRRRPWTTAMVLRTRASTSKLVEVACRGLPASERLRHLVLRVMLLEKEPSPPRQLARFVYALMALDHHAEHDGLKDGHVHQLIEIAEKILIDFGVFDPDSRLGFLAGEILDVRSRIDSRAGAAWRAAVRQYQACYFARSSEREIQRSCRLTLAERSLRLGNAAGVAQSLGGDELERLSATETAAARILRARAWRLAGDPDAATRELAGSESSEARWELAKARGAIEARHEPLRALVRKGAEFYGARPILETILYLRASDRVLDPKSQPLLKSLVRRDQLDWSRDRELLAFARRLEEAQAGDDLLHRRVEKVAFALEAASQFATLEHEMLAFAAAGRWLARLNAFDLAELCLRRYEALCLGASGGAKRDVLSLAADLQAKPWYSRREKDACLASS